MGKYTYNSNFYKGDTIMDRNILNGKKHIHFIGIGGSLDVLSGTKKRAPKLFIKLNCEWLYRIMCEPKRIGRFYNNNVKFFNRIKKEAKKNEKN